MALANLENPASTAGFFVSAFGKTSVHGIVRLASGRDGAVYTSCEKPGKKLVYAGRQRIFHLQNRNPGSPAR